MSIRIFLSSALFLMQGCIHTRYVYPQRHVVSYPYPAPKILKSDAMAYLTAVNRMRSQGSVCGSLGYFPPAPALHWSNALYAAAYEHSVDMATNNMFAHQGSGGVHDWTKEVKHLSRGSTFSERIDNNGYQQWKSLAQNIAAGKSTVEMTMQQWKASAHHCANIMNPLFEDFGMAHVRQEGTDFRDYWTQNFAAHQ